MLRSEHSIVAYENGRALPDRLMRGRHRQYLQYAARMLAVYRSGAGRTRRELHQSIWNILASEEDCDRRRIAAFCKLLDDRGEYDMDQRGAASQLRLRVFTWATKHHPLVAGARPAAACAECDVKSMIAGKLGRQWPQVEAALYADIVSSQTLKRFDGIESPQSLLSRYNVAQVQACLYRAESMSIHASADFKAILRSVRLCGLLHWIHRLADGGYRIDLSGPASAAGPTRRYGADFARFIPALLACREWESRSQVRTRWGGHAQLLLSSRDGLHTRLPPPERFDSSVEQAFAADFGESRDGWRLSREDAILHDGQITFVPDFVLRHENRREVLLEIVGFWTPEYLERKRKTIARFAHRDILLAVAERNRPEMKTIGARVVYYKKRLDPCAILQALGQSPRDSARGSRLGGVAGVR